MSYLDNGVVRVGVDLNHGGAIVFLSRANSRNRINNFDFGRQVQLSFYAGPVPFIANGQHPRDHWKEIGWNPIQTGDDFRNASRLLEDKNDGKSIHVKCQPLQWPLNNIPGECTFDSWLAIDSHVVKVRARLNNNRPDQTQYPARLQELPAVYANAAYHRVISYIGSRPFTDDSMTEIPKPSGSHPWAFWQGTEGWSALLDANDDGLGLITPGRIHFTGGFAGTPGPNDTFGNSTGYLAGQGQEILDHNIAYEFRYELVVGSLREIRNRAAENKRLELPAWTFHSDRQGWHYNNTTDNGWPIADHLHMFLNQADPQMFSPYIFWRAEEAPFLILDAAFQTTQSTATVFWQSHNQAAPKKENTLSFPVEADGEFHRYVIRLADSPAYRGPLIRLRFDPVSNGDPNGWVRIRSIRLAQVP